MLGHLEQHDLFIKNSIEEKVGRRVKERRRISYIDQIKGKVNAVSCTKVREWAYNIEARRELYEQKQNALK